MMSLTEQWDEMVANVKEKQARRGKPTDERFILALRAAFFSGAGATVKCIESADSDEDISALITQIAVAIGDTATQLLALIDKEDVNDRKAS